MTMHKKSGQFLLGACTLLATGENEALDNFLIPLAVVFYEMDSTFEKISPKGVIRPSCSPHGRRRNSVRRNVTLLRQLP